MMMTHPSTPAPERAALEKQIANAEHFLENSVGISAGILCPLPVQARIYWWRKRLAALGDKP